MLIKRSIIIILLAILLTVSACSVFPYEEPFTRQSYTPRPVPECTYTEYGANGAYMSHTPAHCQYVTRQIDWRLFVMLWPWLRLTIPPYLVVPTP